MHSPPPTPSTPRAANFICNADASPGNTRDTIRAQSKDAQPETENMNARESAHRIPEAAQTPAGLESHAVASISAALTVAWIDEAEHRTWFLYEATR
jgi:hypothetical protein